MADQEFSSPGDHMASRSSSSSTGHVSSGTIYAGSSSPVNVSFGPPVSNLYNYDRDRDSGYVSSYNSHDDIDTYLGRYLKYNLDLFNQVKDYDMMMSNTAIRRQMEDLKAAGINPILAGRLGGATYKGVSAPYVSISPSGALQAEVSKYSADVSRANALDNIDAELYRTQLSNQNMLKIARENNLNDLEVAQLMNGTNIITETMRDTVTTSGQDKNFVASLIGDGVRSLATLGAIAYYKGHNGKGSPPNNGSLPANVKDTVDRDAYNEWFANNHLGNTIGNSVNNVVGNFLNNWSQSFNRVKGSLGLGLGIGAVGAGALGLIGSTVPIF